VSLLGLMTWWRRRRRARAVHAEASAMEQRIRDLV
jgi:hypothetical protein